VTPDLHKVVEMIAEAERLARNPSPVLQEQARRLLAKAERALQGGPRLEPRVTCAACWRQDRTWFLTAVAAGRIWPLCSRACLEGWRLGELGYGRVFRRDGEEWQDEPMRRAA
jgi:hypothetical protein